MTDEVQHGWVYYDKELGLYVYRAYAIGGCLRSMVAARLGETASPMHANIQASMDVSSSFEDEILNRVSGDVIWRQKTVELPVYFDGEGYGDDDPAAPSIIVRGHIDGLHQQSDAIVDAKALSENNFTLFEEGGLDALGKLGKKYTWQGATYGHATGRHFRLAIGLKLKDAKGVWRIAKVILSDPMDPEEMVPLADIQAKIAEVERCAELDELPDCTDNCRDGDPYSECHIFQSASQGDDDTYEKLSRYAELKELLGSDDKNPQKRSGLLGELEDIKDWMKATYGNPRQTEKVTAGPYTATVVPNKGREFVDGSRLRKERPDVYEEFVKWGDPFYTLIVKAAKGQEASE